MSAAGDTTTSTVQRRAVTVWGDRIDLGVQVKGDGPPLVYLHPAGDMSWETCEGARAMFATPEDAEAAKEAQIGLVWALGCTAKFLWPIPDRGLAKRIHRLSAPTLILWGEQDALIPVAYGHEFARLIPDSRLEIVPDCGHIPQVEQPAITIEAVGRFLAN